MKKIKAFAPIRVRTGLVDTFGDIRATKREAQLVANWREEGKAYKYKVVPCEIILKRSLRSPKKKIK